MRFEVCSFTHFKDRGSEFTEGVIRGHYRSLEMVLLTMVYIITTVSAIYGFGHGLHTLVTGQLTDMPTRGCRR